MENIVQDSPNLPVAETVPVQKVDSGLESIAAKNDWADRNIHDPRGPKQQ